MNSKEYVVFVGGNGVGTTNTLEEAKNIGYEKALEYLHRVAEQAHKQHTRYTTIAKDLVRNGLNYYREVES